MPRYKVTVKQLVWKTAWKEFEADDKDDAKIVAEMYHDSGNQWEADWNWQDSDGVEDFEVISVEEIDE